MYSSTFKMLVQDLASRFADGRLSNDMIFEADDKELYEILTAVRGIGNVCFVSCLLMLY